MLLERNNRLLCFLGALVAIVLIDMVYKNSITTILYERTNSFDLNLRSKPSIDPSLENDIHTEVFYEPSILEDSVIKRADEFGFNKPFCSVCNMWKNDTLFLDLATDMKDYLQQLDEYNDSLKRFTRSTNLSLHDEITQVYKDGKGSLSWDDASKEVCKIFHTMSSPFKSSKLFSHSSRSGFLEPLVPPLRHPKFCTKNDTKIVTMGDESRIINWKTLKDGDDKNITWKDVLKPQLDYRYDLDLGYIVHDFYTMCRKLKYGSRVILVDMGASLDFHGKQNSPAIYLTSTFQKMGFNFDHIYAFEIKLKDPKDVYERVPNELVPAYHWMNIPVESTKGSFLNPLQMILHHYREDDLILVKLDIDTAALELELTYQLLEESPSKKSLSRLVDHFYFEHHVKEEEFRYAYGGSANGTVKDSLLLFQTLRQKGIASHHWV